MGTLQFLKFDMRHWGPPVTGPIALCESDYSGPPLMRPLLGNNKTGRIRGVAAGEGEGH